MTPRKQGRFVFNPNGIKVIREKSGLSQEQLSEKLGVAKTAISRWEKGKVTPDANSLAMIYSVAKENRIEAQFFKEAETKTQKGRSNLYVSWDYQNMPIMEYQAVERAKLIRDTLIERFPSVSHSVFKIFASPMYSYVTNQISQQGWRLHEFSYDIDEELDAQSWSDCNQAPKDTIFVLITRDGDYIELIEELRQKGVRVYLMAPDNASHRLLETVGKRWRIKFPE